MTWVRLLELALLVLGAVFVITQMIWPVFSGDKLFPAFRAKSVLRLQREENAKLQSRLDALEERLQQNERLEGRISAIDERFKTSDDTENGVTK